MYDTPFILYSSIFVILVARDRFDMAYQAIISHLFAYFAIFKLYRDGHDIGFDYDPF
jgi:hypothetical protein